MTYFQNLTDKIRSAPFLETPFRHIEINDFLPDDVFQAVISAPEIRCQKQGMQQI